MIFYLEHSGFLFLYMIMQNVVDQEGSDFRVGLTNTLGTLKFQQTNRSTLAIIILVLEAIWR